eukprot:TRINITY_DN109315_c0_g1_i1.p1 TRINITY_DN109315_c0_g1~~TRINITY_DN109315_c0_g1_i1.p1  ORF type:complete len:183 (+),score=14.70 TRINITY_DN109315_c0_g1_i1:28-549(+)
MIRFWARHHTKGACPGRDQLLNEFTNLGVVCALLGGFALEVFTNIDKSDAKTTLGGILTGLMFFAVHLNTMAAICAGVSYRAVNLLQEHEAVEWSKRNRHLQSIVVICGSGGGVLYIVGVVFLGLVKYDEIHWQILFTAAGTMCCIMLGYYVWAAHRPTELETAMDRVNPIGS